MDNPATTTIALLALLKVKNVGRRSALKIISSAKEAGDSEVLRLKLEEALARANFSTDGFFTKWCEAQDLLKESGDAGIAAYSFFDQKYPARLKKIPDPPAVLFVKGNFDALLARKAVAVVGTREPTAFGGVVAHRTGKTAAEADWVIVSGLAHGCDTFAHQGCVDARGRGVAVLAHGLDKVYPAANRDLAKRLLDTEGCLVSEYPIKMAPGRSAFAERDRIQSGLSDGIIVIETGVVGGTMHTVRFAREQKRPIGAIDHPVKWHVDEKVKGNRKLIDDKMASPISDSSMLATFLNSLVDDQSLAEKLPDPAQKSWAF